MSLFLEQFCGGGLSHIDNLPRDENWKQGKHIETTFSDMVDRLRSPTICKNAEINKLAALLWRCVGNRICPVGAMDRLTCMSFWCEVKGSETNMAAFLICPLNWCQMLRDDFYMQLGAIVYNASKVKDYWNNKIPGLNITKEESHERAMAYEAEWLAYCQKNDPEFQPNEYQKQVLGKFPGGLTDAPHGMIYEGREFPESPAAMLLAGPPWPIDTYGLSSK